MSKTGIRYYKKIPEVKTVKYIIHNIIYELYVQEVDHKMVNFIKIKALQPYTYK